MHLVFHTATTTGHVPFCAGKYNEPSVIQPVFSSLLGSSESLEFSKPEQFPTTENNRVSESVCYTWR